jgi:trk system potassium uptake protein TrkA
MASEVAQILAIPSAIDAESFAEGKVEMMELVVSKGSYFANKMLKDLHLADSCIVSAIFRKDDVIIPHGNDSMQENDHIVVIGQPSAMKEIRELLGEIAGRRSKVMIIGGGIVGFYLAKLIANSETDIKIIESRRARCEEIADKLSGALVLNGDGTDINLLKDEGINEMDVVISVTDSDEKNLLCSLIAKKLGAKKVIARSDRSDYISLFEMVGVDSAVSPRGATVNEVLKLTMGTGIGTMTTIEGQKAGIIEYTASAKSKIVGKPLREVKFPPGAIVSMIVHNGRTIVPRGSHVVEENDRVVVFTLPSSIAAVEKLFK